MAGGEASSTVVDLNALKSVLSTARARPALRLPSGYGARDDSATESCSYAVGGRIAAAVDGDDNWHEAAAQTEKQRALGATRTVLLRVAHHPAVVIRASPHLEAEVVTYCRTGTTLLAVARSGLWVRLADANFLSNSYPEAWLLLAHNAHGRLVDLISGSLDTLPEPAMALASADAVARAEPCGASRRVQQTWRVVHSPHVLVRAAPSLGAKMTGYRACGAVLQAVAQRGDWIRLEQSQQLQAVHQREGGAASPAAAAAQREEWVLTVHPELGQLLQRV